MGMPGHPVISESGKPILLLGNNRNEMFNFQLKKYLIHAIQDCKRRLYTYIKDKDTYVPNYHKQFKNKIDVVKHNGGTFGIER